MVVGSGAVAVLEESVQFLPERQISLPCDFGISVETIDKSPQIVLGDINQIKFLSVWELGERAEERQLQGCISRARITAVRVWLAYRGKEALSIAV